MSIYYVYILFRRDTGAPFYVGYGKGNRWDSHLYEAKRGDGVNKHKMRIIAKMQKEGVSIPRIKFAESLTLDSAKKLEIWLIACLGRTPNGPLVNLTSGGEGVSALDSEILKRSAEKRTGVSRSKETIEKLRQSHLGKSPTAETRAKLSAAGKGKKLTTKQIEVLREINRRPYYDDDMGDCLCLFCSSSALEKHAADCLFQRAIDFRLQSE